jgi:hypothetical protein
MIAVEELGDASENGQVKLMANITVRMEDL